ncbi:HmuY family protein [Sinomicrobium soli]|uniref:HmuY family protein n=1 Tax=Sinomicrobium sp. N-1-3-6 TaxID=2219864 RepID=UPI0011BF5CD5|nr:HmuY family protein [Sinomicrobium sp. N-1-3-6]
MSLTLSCSSDDGRDPDTEPDFVTDESIFNRLITVSNLGGELPEGHEPMDEQDPLYYSLENEATVNTHYKQTDRWDISFSGIYRSFAGGNNGSDVANLGYKGPGVGGILILEKAFDDVIDIPDDSEFRTPTGIIGTDDAGAFGNGIGYYCYDFGGDIFNDGSYEYQHIAYCLADTTTVYEGTEKERTLLPRTMIVKTAKGNYAKIKMISLYKDLTDPDEWKRNSPHVYYTFQYVLAKAGSSKFEITQ